jgi:hypothetical protein
MKSRDLAAGEAAAEETDDVVDSAKVYSVYLLC